MYIKNFVLTAAFAVLVTSSAFAQGATGPLAPAAGVPQAGVGATAVVDASVKPYEEPVTPQEAADLRRTANALMAQNQQLEERLKALEHQSATPPPATEHAAQQPSTGDIDNTATIAYAEKVAEHWCTQNTRDLQTKAQRNFVEDQCRAANNDLKAARGAQMNSIGVAAKNSSATKLTYRDSNGMAMEASQEWGNYDLKKTKIIVNGQVATKRAENPQPSFVERLITPAVTVQEVEVMGSYTYLAGGHVSHGRRGTVEMTPGCTNGCTLR